MLRAGVRANKHLPSWLIPWNKPEYFSANLPWFNVAQNFIKFSTSSCVDEVTNNFPIRDEKIEEPINRTFKWSVISGQNDRLVE